MGWSIILCADWFNQRFLQVKCIQEFVTRTAFVNKLTAPNTLGFVKVGQKII